VVEGFNRGEVGEESEEESVDDREEAEADARCSSRPGPEAAWEEEQ
jgi:hypothetical protein